MYKKRWIFCVIIILVIICILLEIIWAVLKNRQAGNGKEIRITSCKELPEDLEEKKVSQSIAELKNEREVVDGAVCIVSGTVIDYTYAKIEVEEKTSYKTILQFQISKVLKGNVAKKSIDILLPVNMKANIKIEDNDYIEMLERGVEAVLVIQSNEDTTKHFTLNGRQIAYRKLADYYYSGNRRDIIVRKNNCLYYDKLVYQNLSHKNTLAEVEDYIKDLAAESN